MEPEKPVDKGLDVDPGLDDDEEEKERHEQDEVLQGALEKPDSPSAALPVAPAQGRAGHEQAEGDGRPGDVQAGHVEDVPADARGQGILGELPDDGGQKDHPAPGPGQGRMEPFAEDVVRPGLCHKELVADGREHNDAQEHGHGLDPEKVIAEDRTGENGRTGRPGPQGQGALHPARP